MPVRGVRFRCTPPKKGISTWKTAKDAAVTKAATVISLPPSLLLLAHTRAALMSARAQIHQIHTQKRVKDPSGR
jgi:hypothetical protein